MNNIRVLTTGEEYEFLKKVLPMYDAMLQAKAPNPTLGLDRTGWKHMRNMVAVLLMLDAGLRVGEVVKMRYTDMYFNEQPVRNVTIRSAVAKGGEERTVPVSERLSNALIYYRPDPELIAQWPNTQKIISRSKEGPGITTRAVEKMTKWAGIRAFGEPVNPHMLRHTFATKLMKITDMRTVQALLGHKNLNSTQVYTHPSSDDMSLAIEKLNKQGEA